MGRKQVRQARKKKKCKKKKENKVEHWDRKNKGGRKTRTQKKKVHKPQEEQATKVWEPLE